MSDTHILVLTELEEPQVFLSQEDFSELMDSLRLDPSFRRKRCNLYALAPDTDSPIRLPSRMRAIRLRKVGSSDPRSSGTAYFQEALYQLNLMIDDSKLKLEYIQKWRDQLQQIEETLHDTGRQNPQNSDEASRDSETAGAG